LKKKGDGRSLPTNSMKAAKKRQDARGAGKEGTTPTRSRGLFRKRGDNEERKPRREEQRDVSDPPVKKGKTSSSDCWAWRTTRSQKKTAVNGKEKKKKKEGLDEFGTGSICNLAVENWQKKDGSPRESRKGGGMVGPERGKKVGRREPGSLDQTSTL